MDPSSLPVDTLLLLRFVKLAAAMLLAAGTIGAFLPDALADRKRAALFLAGPGFGLSWAMGFVLAWARGQSPISGWLLGSMVLSIFSLNVVLWATGKEGRRSAAAAALAIGTLIATLALMVWRPR
jgi:hypothetical protein